MTLNLKTIVSIASALALLGLIGCHARKCAPGPEEKTVAKPAAADESKGWKDSWPKRPPLPGSTAEPPPPTEQFTMDRHFVFMFRDQDLAIEQMERRKEIEKKYLNIGADAEQLQKRQSEIRALQLDIGKKRKALFAEFGITPEQWAANMASEEARKEREVYLRFNYDVKLKLEEYQRKQEEIRSFYGSLK